MLCHFNCCLVSVRTRLIRVRPIDQFLEDPWLTSGNRPSRLWVYLQPSGVSRT